MELFWRIRYFDRADRQFKDRDLFLDTDKLSPEMKAIVELAVERKDRAQREMLRHRPLFYDQSKRQVPQVPTHFVGIAIPDYFEDEAGREMPLHELGPLMTGDPAVILLPHGCQPHDTELYAAQRQPYPIANVNLSADKADLLGCFVRDLLELEGSAFFTDGPGTFCEGGATGPFIETAASDDEIRSHVSIFRRLYMANEPANFLKAVAVFTNAVGSHPYGKWVGAVAQSYETKLGSAVGRRPELRMQSCNSTAKRVIDVFLNTRYAHQPSEDRQRQYNACLADVGGQQPRLFYLFLYEIWVCSIDMINAGRVIADWFSKYCDHHKITPNVLPSVSRENPGIGTKEKEAARDERLLREKTEELAKSLWENRGRPAGGHTQFLDEARAKLQSLLA